MQLGVSVIICCYNSASRLPATLKHLAGQAVPAGIAWEVVVVNNNSTDTTAATAAQWWAQSGSRVSFQVVDEPTPGLANARAKGLATARYEYVLFCDDDNWLAERYVATAFEIMQANPAVAAAGGWGEEALDAPPPAWFDAYHGVYAVRQYARDTGAVEHLYGAGMVIRRSHWNVLVQAGYQSRLSDRVGKKVTSGGDTEMCLAFRLAGYVIWYDRRLQFRHYIPKERLTRKYVARFFAGLAQTTTLFKPFAIVLDQNITSTAQVKRFLPLRDAVYFFRTNGLVYLGQYLLGNFLEKYRWDDNRKVEIQYEYALACRWLLHWREWYRNLEYILNLKGSLLSLREEEVVRAQGHPAPAGHTL
jgi:glycosyltransferase involved in cell wall biosynthesis